MTHNPSSREGRRAARLLIALNVALAAALCGCGGGSTGSAGVTVTNTGTSGSVVSDPTPTPVATPATPEATPTPAPTPTPVSTPTPAPVTGGNAVIPTVPTGPMNPSAPVYDGDLPTCREAYGPNYLDQVDHLLRWSGLPLRVRFATVTRYEDGSGLTVEDRVRAGLNQWVAASGGAITWTETDAADAEVVIKVEKVGSRPGAGQPLGMTRTTWAGSDRMTHAETTISVWDGMTGEDFNRVAITGAHEFGHALGIDGHSNDRSDIMFAANLGGQSVTTRDLNTVWSLYCGDFRGNASRAANANANHNGGVNTKVIE